MVSGTGYFDQFLSEEAAGSLVQESLNSLMLDGRKVLVLIPDGTRSMPMPMMFTLFEKYLAGKTAALDYLVASVLLVLAVYFVFAKPLAGATA